jgi:uncharacterized protein (DUF433 family)
MAVLADIGALIDRIPDVHSGRPVLAGTGVTVHRIANWYKLGWTPEEIADKYEHVSLAHIHAALAYYHANQTWIDQELAEDDRAARDLAGQFVSLRPQ